MNFLRQDILAQRERGLIWVPVFFGLGIIFYFHLREEPPLWPGLIAAATTLAALLTLCQMRGREEGLRATLFIVLGGIFLICAGFAAAQWRTERVYTPILTKKLAPVTIRGTVREIEPKEEGKGVRLVLDTLEVEKLPADKTPRRVRLLLRQEAEIRPGDRVEGLAGLNPPSGPVQPGAFDFQRHAYFKGLGAVGFFYRPPMVLSHEGGALSGLFENIRAKITAEVRDNVRQPYSAIVGALLTGQRQAIREEDKEAMREAGLAHLLAISGLHVGMVAGAIFFFVRLALAAVPFIALNYPVKKIAALIALIGAAYYTFAVGAAIPAQRALMMTGLVLIAVLFDRSPFSLRLVAFAAMVILILSPEALMGVSFQMSFAAVTCLILFYDRVRPWWSSMYARAGVGRRIFMYFLGVTATTIIAGFATGLFALYHFQQFALYGVLSNFIAVPIVGFIIMPAAVLYYLLTLIGLEFIALHIMEWGVSWVLATAHWTAGLSGAVINIAAWPKPAFTLMLAGALFALLWKGRLKAVGLMLFLSGLCLLPFAKYPDILIGPDAGLIAVRAENGDLVLSSRRTARYTAENWQRLNGREGITPKVWPKERLDPSTGLQCGGHGCRLERDGQKISFPKSETVLDEECLWAELLIAPFPVRCQGPYIFDLFEAKRQGTADVFFEKGRIKIITDRDIRGDRPWTAYALE